MDFIPQIIFKSGMYFLIISVSGYAIIKLITSSTHEETLYTVRYHKKHMFWLFLILALVFTGILLFAFSFPSNLEGKKYVITITLLIMVNILLYVIALHYSKWQVYMDENSIFYRAGIFFKKNYSYNELKHCSMDKYYRIVLYFDDGRKTVLPDTTGVAYSRLLQKNHIKICVDDVPKNTQEFSMQYKILHKGVSIVSALCFLAFTILSMHVGNRFATWLFCVAFLCALFQSIQRVCEKIVVSKKGVEIHGFLKKTKFFSFAQMKWIKRKVGDDLFETVYVYSDEKLLFKYSDRLENKDLLEEIIKKRKLKKKK